MEETKLESLFREPLMLIADSKFYANHLDCHIHDCQELRLQLDTLSSLLSEAVKMVRQGNPRFCEAPTQCIVDETSRTLEKCCLLLRKCTRGGFLTWIFTITTAEEFRKANFSVKDAIANVEWLLESVNDEELGCFLSMPPITISASPIRSAVWSCLSKLKGGSPELKEAAASDVESMSRSIEQFGKFIIQDGGVPLLLKILYDGTTEGKIKAGAALGNLAVGEEQVRLMVQQGVVPACVYTLENGEVALQEKITWALAEMISKDPEIQKELGDAKAVVYLTSLMFENCENLRDATGEMLSHGCTVRDSCCKKGGECLDFKHELVVQVTRVLWLLAKNNVTNSRRITETRAMLAFATLMEKEKGEVQKNVVMAVMELAASAERDMDFRKFAFKLTLPAAKAIVNQLYRLIVEESVEPLLQMSCITAVGSLAKAFTSKEDRIIKALVSKLSMLDGRDQGVIAATLNTLLKFTDANNYLSQEHSLAILEVPGLPFLVQLVVYDVEKSLQDPAILLLSQLALQVGRIKSKVFEEAAALSVLKSMRNSSSNIEQHLKDCIFDAICCLEFGEAGERRRHSSHAQ